MYWTVFSFGTMLCRVAVVGVAGSFFVGTGTSGVP